MQEEVGLCLTSSLLEKPEDLLLLPCTGQFHAVYEFTREINWSIQHTGHTFSWRDHSWQALGMDQKAEIKLLFNFPEVDTELEFECNCFIKKTWVFEEKWVRKEKWGSDFSWSPRLNLTPMVLPEMTNCILSSYLPKTWGQVPGVITLFTKEISIRVPTLFTSLLHEAICKLLPKVRRGQNCIHLCFFEKI